MAASESEVETTIPGYGDHAMRNLHGHILSQFRASAETPLHHDDGGTGNGGPLMREVPRDGGAFGPQCDVGCDNEDHFIKGRHITCDRVANAIAIKAWIARAAWALEIEQHYVLALEWYEDHAELNEQGEVRLSR
jgi:hypothetical protein